MGRICVGIDWADDHHDVYVTDDSAAVLDSFRISHSYGGFEELKKRLGTFSSNPARLYLPEILSIQPSSSSPAIRSYRRQYRSTTQ